MVQCSTANPYPCHQGKILKKFLRVMINFFLTSKIDFESMILTLFNWAAFCQLTKYNILLPAHSLFWQNQAYFGYPRSELITELILDSRILKMKLLCSDPLCILILSWDPVKLLMVTISLHSSKDNWSIMTSNQGTSFSSSCTLSKLWHARETDN